MKLNEYVSAVLMDRYKQLPGEEKKRVKDGVQWASEQFDNVPDELEAVRYCKDCEWCFVPLNRKNWSEKTLWCNLNNFGVTEDFHCGKSLDE